MENHTKLYNSVALQHFSHTIHLPVFFFKELSFSLPALIFTVYS